MGLCAIVDHQPTSHVPTRQLEADCNHIMLLFEERAPLLDCIMKGTPLNLAFSDY